MSNNPKQGTYFYRTSARKWYGKHARGSVIIAEIYDNDVFQPPRWCLYHDTVQAINKLMQKPEYKERLVNNV